MWNSRSRGIARSGLALAAALAALLAGCGGGGRDPLLEIRTLSNRADLVSGGDALVEVVVPGGASVSGLKVDVDGRDVSSAFARRSDGRVTGLVTGLATGNNVISASAEGASAARLTVVNAPRSGPVFSGAQIVPYLCATPTAIPAGGSGASATPATNFSGLSGAPDAQCNIPTEFKLYYRSTASSTCTFSLPDPTPAVAATSTAPAASSPPPANGCFKPFDASAPVPADMATTVTDAGRTVNYIVRVERGTMNRGIYDIAVLFDPASPWTATAPQAQWNGKILHVFGSSTGQPRRQIRPATSWTSEDKALSRGYMFVTSSMTDSARNSNRVLMAETVMMLKEHVADTYGPIKFTMGQGCSGGSINSHMSASIAPGLLDGLTINCAYPDSETTGMEVSDCVQLVEAYQKPQWLALMSDASAATVNAKKAAINGHLDQSGCHAWYNNFGSNGKVGLYQQRTVNNTTGVITQSTTTINNCELPNSLVYDPVTNPGGARCSAWDWAASIFGKAADGIRALDTRDNEGVQYGLKALLADSITGEEFVTLNEIIGGIDKDANFRAERSKADPAALDIAYRSGIVMSGKNLAKVAELDTRGWDDSAIVQPPGGTFGFGIHHIWRSFSIRDRLDREFGDHRNHAMWRFGRGLLPSAALAVESFLAMDTWLTNLKADTSVLSLETKVRNARPASAADFCIPSSDPTQSVRVTDQAVCDADPFLKPQSSPRQVAGGNLSENILKCALRPVSEAEYGGRLDGGQLSRLRAVFSTGVCDWTKPGIGQQDAVAPLNFRNGPGGVAFGPAPGSTPK